MLTNLKVWFVDELKKHTEVDSEMLADYIITTLETDDDEAKLRENCHSSLLEILEDGTFLDMVDLGCFSRLERRRLSFLSILLRPSLYRDTKRGKPNIQLAQ